MHAHLFPREWASRGRMPESVFDVDGLVARLDEGAVQRAIVSDPHIWYGDLDVCDIAQVRDYNDFAAGLSDRTDGRLVGMGTVVPWRGPDHVHEARRAIRDLGLVGLAVPTSDNGQYLDAVPDDFWSTATDLDVPVFLHPGGTVVGQELMGEYRLAEVCGRPLDTTVTLARAILTGVLERHDTLKLLCSHAGGAICTIADRLDFGHELRDYAPLGPWGAVHLPRPPSEYVQRLWLDTVTYGPKPLRLALETVGPEHVCFGSDGPPVPFPLSRHLANVGAAGLDEKGMKAVLGGNAEVLFGLDSGRAS
ncbi:MAG: amidohydrolase family protein [Actinomycetota bacterium]|nr:amidohydrolase family protein [Actinomycetota bacterium]